MPEFRLYKYDFVTSLALANWLSHVYLWPPVGRSAAHWFADESRIPVGILSKNAMLPGPTTAV